MRVIDDISRYEPEYAPAAPTFEPQLVDNSHCFQDRIDSLKQFCQFHGIEIINNEIEALVTRHDNINQLARQVIDAELYQFTTKSMVPKSCDEARDYIKTLEEKLRTKRA